MDRAAKIVLILFMGLNLGLYAEQIEVSADDFFADEGKQMGEFVGNVNVKKGKFNELSADRAIVHFNAKRQPTKYIATGKAKFKVFMKQKHYEGSGDTLTYEPIKDIYTITGNGYLHEIDSDKNVYGEKIVVNQKDGTYSVSSGDKKPVKFIFEIEDKAK